MLLNCTTKGCMKSSEAKLDKTTGKVICEECGNPIDGITKYMIRCLDTCGQIMRSNTKEAFQSLCKTCNKNQSLYVKGDKAYCKTCNSQVIVSSAFFNGLKIYLEQKASQTND
jgi:hypothetical protein